MSAKRGERVLGPYEQHNGWRVVEVDARRKRKSTLHETEAKALRYMDLQPGDMQFINNYHVLHARTAFEDHPEPGRKRFLKRLWLETRKLTDRPLHFQLAGSNKAWWARKRTRAS